MKKKLFDMPVVAPSGARVGVTIYSDLSMSCRCTQSAEWCNHRTTVMQDRLDGMLVQALIETWEKADLPTVGEDTMVPLAPTIGIFHPVRLDNNYRGKVIATLPSPPFRPEVEPIELGVLAPGDGLASIRELVKDAIRPGMSNPKLECEDKRHGYRQEMAIRGAIADNDKSAMFATSWHVYMTGSCQYCSGGRSPSLKTQSFDDVLVDSSIIPKARTSPWK